MTEGQNEEPTERPRPRVVDKRVSARGEGSPQVEAPQVEAPQVEAPRTQEPPAPEAPPAEPEPPSSSAPDGAGVATLEGDRPSSERVWTPEQEAEAQRLIDAMSATPALDWVLNSCVTLANLAGVKIDSGDLPGARLAIDALAELVDGLGDRLGDAHAPLKSTLAQLQLAFAQAATPPAGPQGH